MYDVIVVGARCAGSATAMLLARRGHRVLLVDRATFPSDTISGHMIFHRGTLRLKKWGLLDKVIASGCPPITRLETDIDNTLLSADMPYVEGAPVAIGPRRTVLDSILLNAAVEAGVEMREGFSVNELLTDGDRVVGIRGQDKAGLVVSERAQIVVGADGKHSRIAQLVQAVSYMEVPSITAWKFLHLADNSHTHINFHEIIERRQHSITSKGLGSKLLTTIPYPLNFAQMKAHQIQQLSLSQEQCSIGTTSFIVASFVLDA